MRLAERADDWHAACAADAALAALGCPGEVGFGIRAGEEVVTFAFHDGRPVGAARRTDFEVVAEPEAWREFFSAEPRPPHHHLFGMLMRVPGTAVTGDEVCFAQHAHLVRRVLEIGRAVIAGPPLAARETGGAALPGPAPSASRETARPDHIEGRYLRAEVGREPVRLFYEHAGTGRDVLFLHTAGADSRQFHHLMNDPGLADRYHLVAFDLPWHGRSTGPPGEPPGAYALDTDRYVATIMAVIEGLDLDAPIVVGCSMGGEICLELALRHPDRLGGVVACEAADHVPGRQVRWARDPRVNQTLFVPEWVEGLMAPQSPPEHRREVWWGYSQGGFGTFAGDILFYSGDWDARDRVGRIDTARCPVVMLTGEYDYSCTPEMSRATAGRIPGALYRTMPRLGHFPMAENPEEFAGHLLWALDEIDGKARGTAG
ncbi:alpha/beta fold hydrolase [Nonomuraea gerenzanensis]|uniref:2-hydroxy-6-oxo-6-phenylhexa-2,4-dienoate hydrolase n=1 Tax=Nonomuraea gerenzanensis TaxID=93944 RepID=A0A1M4DZ12_9ACTN|nr:alpha/beta hydrolase [Nonomuraea gerenzanensis]UBU14136.1 alpha/beta hydrolase [Nonomuraea gerenzanensis]SBO91825.1 2-hydroxy-6-oxo-6-phenylhexa-2,4-dienoate hydrolase [Nonomuraea gerenzanensis]